MTPTRKHFVTPTSDASKLEEITWLTNLAEDVRNAGNSYVASLFTPDLVAWAASQIQNDFPPDLYDYFQGEIIKNSDLTCKFACECNSHEADNKEFKTKIEGATQVAKNLNDKITSLELGFDANVKARQALETGNWELTHQLAETENYLRIAEAKLVELKARLFDLQETAKAK
jgi:septal ring factor EnvC (AmiA/AmiB activator)